MKIRIIRITILLAVLLIITLGAIAQAQRNDFHAYMDSVFRTAGITVNAVPTGILYHRVAPIAGPDEYSTTDTVSSARFMQAVHELRSAAYDTMGFPTYHQV